LQGLKKAIDDPNPVVNIASVMALGQMGSSAFEILVESLNTTDNVAKWRSRMLLLLWAIAVV
jgi:bilin biosynthesis protein